MAKSTIFAVLLVSCSSFIHGFDFSSLNLQSLGETIMGFDQGPAGMMEAYSALAERCQKNGVQLDIMQLIGAYSCMQKIFENGTSNTADVFTTMCKKWDPAMKCVKPVLKQLEGCLSDKSFDLRKVLSEGLDELRKPLCNKDTSFFKDIENGGIQAVQCLSANMEKIVDKTVQCFKKVKGDAADTKVCEGFDTYKQCFLDSLSACNNKKAEKSIQRILEETGLQNLIYKYILKCDTKDKISDQSTKSKSDKTSESSKDEL